MLPCTAGQHPGCLAGPKAKQRKATRAYRALKIPVTLSLQQKERDCPCYYCSWSLRWLAGRQIQVQIITAIPEAVTHLLSNGPFDSLQGEQVIGSNNNLLPPHVQLVGDGHVPVWEVENWNSVGWKWMQDQILQARSAYRYAASFLWFIHVWNLYSSLAKLKSKSINDMSSLWYVSYFSTYLLNTRSASLTCKLESPNAADSFKVVSNPGIIHTC